VPQRAGSTAFRLERVVDGEATLSASETCAVAMYAARDDGASRHSDCGSCAHRGSGAWSAWAGDDCCAAGG